MNKNNRLVAWGIILSIGLAFLNAWEVFGPANENTYSIAGLGMIGFGIWGVVILFKTAPKQNEIQ